MNSRYSLALLALIGATILSGCNQPHSEEAAKNEKQSDPPSVTQSAELKAAEAAIQLRGVAIVLNPDALLQIDADIRAITIAADFSKATAGRYRAARALSRQTVENAERQAGADTTQQQLLETRLKHTWGEKAPFLETEAREKLIADLSSGARALVRLDFADLTGGEPRNVRVAPLAAGEGTGVKTMWPAPSGNQSMPGVSYFALIDAGPGLRPGDRARLIAAGGQATSGVVIPNSAIVVYAGQSWCYIETAPKKYERRAITLNLPVEDGYMVTSGFAPGMRVVVRGASLLLSREAGPDDEDDDGAKKGQPSAPETKTSNPALETTPASKAMDGHSEAVATKAATKADAGKDKDPD